MGTELRDMICRTRGQALDARQSTARDSQLRLKSAHETRRQEARSATSSQPLGSEERETDIASPGEEDHRGSSGRRSQGRRGTRSQGLQIRTQDRTAQGEGGREGVGGERASSLASSARIAAFDLRLWTESRAPLLPCSCFRLPIERRGNASSGTRELPPSKDGRRLNTRDSARIQ